MKSLIRPIYENKRNGQLYINIPDQEKDNFKKGDIVKITKIRAELFSELGIEVV